MIKATGLVKTFTRTENDRSSDGKRLSGRRRSASKSLLSSGSKSRKTEFHAVDGISLEVREGEILGVLGPNGAGKTTLLRMLGKLMKPTEGTVTILDADENEITDDIKIKQKIGYLSGNTKLYKRLTPREMLVMLGNIYGLDTDDTKKRVEEISDILKLSDFIDNRIERLSTGQTQRISIARCLLHSPDVYIFDEPTLGLDIISSRSIIEFMKSEKAAGKAVLYSTHYMEEAEFLCDRILMVHKGRIIAEGSPESLRQMTGSSNLRDTFLSLIQEDI